MLDANLRNHRATHASGPRPSAMAHPWHWWGPLGAPPDPPCLARLIAGGSLSEAVAGLLAAAVRAGASVVVVAIPGGAGKTTLLSTLSGALPEERRPIHLRGRYEDFSAFAPADVTPETAAVLVNEISGHLPIYLWGPGIARLAKLRARGFQLLATAHARGAGDLARLLSGPGANLDPGQASGLFDIVVSLEAGRVAGVEASAGGPAGDVLCTLAGDADSRSALAWLLGAASRAPVLAGIEPGSLPAWERWAATPAGPAALRDRPGAMLANSLRDRTRGAGSP